MPPFKIIIIIKKFKPNYYIHSSSFHYIFLIILPYQHKLCLNQPSTHKDLIQSCGKLELEVLKIVQFDPLNFESPPPNVQIHLLLLLSKVCAQTLSLDKPEFEVL